MSVFSLVYHHVETCYYKLTYSQDLPKSTISFRHDGEENGLAVVGRLKGQKLENTFVPLEPKTENFTHSGTSSLTSNSERLPHPVLQFTLIIVGSYFIWWSLLSVARSIHSITHPLTHLFYSPTTNAIHVSNDFNLLRHIDLKVMKQVKHHNHKKVTQFTSF